ncbi:MAG: TOMM precursor leader peptide-binding protein [Minicystis sp.]
MSAGNAGSWPRRAARSFWLGPFFRHGHACWECLAQRLRLNRQIESYVERRSGAPRPLVTSMAHLPITLRFSADLVALEIAKWVADPALGNGGKITTLDLYTLESAQHHLIQRPQCSVCGDARLQEKRLCRPPFAEGRRGIQPSTASAVMTPEQIVERFAHHISPITGTISRVVSVTTGIPSLYCYVAAFGFGRASQNLTSLRHNLLSQASGTGRTDAQARAGAICEAIERFSGLHHGDEPALRASYRQVTADAIHPNACALYSDRQFTERAAWNALGSPFAIVPEPLDENVPIDWTGVWSVSQGRFKLLPSTYLFYHYPQTSPGGYCYADSNGCAAGSSLEDAMLRGLMELVERDAVAIWWYNRLHAPAVDSASFGDPYFDWLVKLYASYNREVWVLDLTNDIGVPVFAALSRRTDKPVEDILVAFGAHVDPREGILRALCEMNHSLPAVLPIQADGSGEYGYPDKDQQHWWRTATVANQPYLLPRPGAPRLTRSDYVSPPGATPVERCAELIDRLESLGLEVLMIDQTRPDIGLPVVKMVVPGLRHFWARFAPGRLYDVPVQMGWLAAPLAEEDLNPIPMFV